MTYSQAWLEDPTAIRGVLVEATVYDVVAAAEIVVYLSNIGYMTEDSLTSYLPIIRGGVSFTERLDIDGGASMSFGDISISNYNGDYDTWLDVDKYIWCNRPIKVYIGDPQWVCANLASVRDKFELVFDGLISDIDTKDRESLDFKVRDKLERLNTPITENTLGSYGTWVGGQSNMETIKPLIFGEVFNVEPLLIDNANSEYMLCDYYTHVWVSSTTVTTNLITCDSTQSLVIGSVITFGDSNTTATTAIGGITPNTVYYVKTITSSTTFTIATTSSLVTTVVLSNASNLKLVGRMPTTTRPIEAVIEIRDNGIPIYNKDSLLGYSTYLTSTNSSYALATTVIKTSSVGNVITAASTSGFVPGMAITFSGGVVGGLATATTYYIKQVYTNTEFTISSVEALTSTVTLTTALVTVTCNAAISLANVIVCASATEVRPDKKIVFSTSIGGLLANTVYYVKRVYISTVLTPTIFTVSSTIGGAAVTLTTVTAPVNTITALVPSVLVYLDTGRFILNNKPVGTLTASVQGLKNSVSFPAPTVPVPIPIPVLSNNTYTNNIASIIAVIVTQYGKPETKLTIADLDSINFYNFSTAFTQAVGINISDRTNVIEVCNQILSSVGSQLYITRQGLLQLLTIGIPTSDASVAITTSDILHHSLSISQKIEAKPSVNLAYCKDWTVQTGLLTAIPQSHKDLLATEWYNKIYTDNALKTKYKNNAVPEQKETLLLVGSEAATEATRLTNLYSKPKFVYKFTGIARLLSLKLGQAVTLTHPRFGLSAGKTGQVLSLSPNWLKSTIDVEVLI